LLPTGRWQRTHAAGVVDEVSAGLVRIPVEVTTEAAVFCVVARGYDPGQVDAHVLVLEQELAELRWEHDDLAAQRRELAEQREQQNRWRPSVRALGDRMVQLMCLAEQEAGALRTAATVEVARQREQANVAFAARQAEQARALQNCHEAAEREMRLVHSLHQNRREVLATELAQARRDLELEATGTLARAAAQARDLRDAAGRAAVAAGAAPPAEVDHLQRRRDELVAEIVELSAQLLAVVARLSPSHPEADQAS